MAKGALLEKEKLRIVLDTIPSAVVIVEKSGKLSYLNKRALKLYGIDYMGVDLDAHLAKVKVLRMDGTLFPSEELPVSKSLKTGEEIRNVGMIIHNLAGVSVPVLVSSAPLRDDKDSISAAIVIFEDVTEQKKASDAFNAAQKKYQDLIETTSDFIWETDTQGRYTYCSPQMEKLWGIKPEEMIGKTPFDKMLPEAREKGKELFASLVKSSKPFSGMQVPSLDGRDRPIFIEISGVPFFDANGKLLGYRGITRDTTERKKAEEALNHSSERLGLISSITSQLLSATNPQSFLQELCEKVMRFLDCDVFFNFLVDEQKEQLHLNAYSGVSAEVAKTFEWLSFGEAVCGCAAQEGRRIVCENIPDTQDVRTTLVRSFGVKAYAANPIFSKGKVVGTLSFGSKKKPAFQPEELSLMQTVTAQVSVAMERKTDEEKLKHYAEHLEETVKERTKELESNALYSRSLIEASPDPLVTINNQGKITDVNEATILVTGSSREELIGSDFSDYFTEPKMAKAGYEQVFTQGYVKDYPLTIRHKSGKLAHVLYNAAVYKNKAGDVEGAFAAARDITERKRAEEKIKEAEKKLQDAERLAAIGATAGMVGHDIRNPLQAIVGDIYLLKDYLTSMPDMETKNYVTESLAGIEENVNYINKIVLDLQDYARPLKPVAKETDIKPLVEAALQSKVIPENIKTHYHIDKDANTLCTDPDLLKRILNNLGTNAIQAMPKGGEVFVRVAKKGEGTVISIEDTGVGIPEELKSKLFQPMVTTKAKGQGFGLAVVKRMTEALGGTVTFESRVGKGTKFILCFPPLTNQEEKR